MGIKDLKEFIEIMRRGKSHLPKSDRITIKKSKKSNITKFKLRTPKYLLTLKVEDRNKAQRIMDSIPPNLLLEIWWNGIHNSFRLVSILDLESEEVLWSSQLELRNVALLALFDGDSIGFRQVAFA